MKFKVCGMKYNTVEVTALQPDYLGFIFYEKSPRHFAYEISKLPEGIKKVGVFVDEEISKVLEKIRDFKLDMVQLHGDESPDYCRELKKEGIEVIKVFSIKDAFDFSILELYDEVCDYYLFDTKGKLPGGNGYAFDWNVLNNYPSEKPYFLSGGIGLEEIDNVKSFMATKAAKYCHAIDVNSKFEIEPGLKDIVKLEEFKNQLSFRT